MLPPVYLLKINQVRLGQNVKPTSSEMHLPSRSQIEIDWTEGASVVEGGVGERKATSLIVTVSLCGCSNFIF